MIAPFAARKLRIALVADHYPPRLGGIELHVQSLAQQLGRRGHEVHVITTSPGPELLDSIRVHRMRVPLVPVWNIAYTPRGIRPLETLLHTSGFDIVHCHHSVFSPAAACAAYLAQRIGLRTVCTFHSMLRGYTPAFGLLDQCVRWSDWNVTYSAVSTQVASDVRRVLPRRDVPILANGVDPEYWRVRPEPRTRDTVRLVSTMRLAPRKRPRALIDMIARLRARIPSTTRLHVQVLGEGPERSAIEKRIAALGLSDIVELLGRQQRSAVRAAYARADIFVLPTIEESFGLAALEARCAGLPVVAMRASGISGFIADGVDGLLADDDGDFIDAMARLITNPGHRAAITQHNRNSTVPHQWSDVIDAHERVYHA